MPCDQCTDPARCENFGVCQQFRHTLPAGSYEQRIKELAPELGMTGLTDAARDVLAERQRQIEREGWTPQHDDEHSNGELAFAAVCYAHQASARGWVLRELEDGAYRYTHDEPPDSWPDSWDVGWWKPKSPRRDLVRAAALLLAEIERLDRLPCKPGTRCSRSIRDLGGCEAGSCEREEGAGGVPGTFNDQEEKTR